MGILQNATRELLKLQPAEKLGLSLHRGFRGLIREQVVFLLGWGQILAGYTMQKSMGPGHWGKYGIFSGIQVSIPKSFWGWKQQRQRIKRPANKSALNTMF
jgi:hypothetical protein